MEQDKILSSNLLSPVLIGGLGNRLYQIYQCIATSHQFNKKWSIQPLGQDIESQIASILGIKSNAFQENGGHPSKYNLTQVFDLPFETNPINTTRLIQEHSLAQSPGNNKLFSHIPDTLNLHINGCWFQKFWYDYCVYHHLDLKFKTDFSNLKLYKNVLHLRFVYQYDNYGLDKPDYDAIHEIMSKISLTNNDSWAILTNDPSQIQEKFTKADIFGPNDLDVYETLYLGSKAENLIMAPSTLSAWMAYLESDKIHKKVFVPNSFIQLHGMQAIDLSWTVFGK